MTQTPSQSSDYVRIFDTTLRDGEQSPGATLTSAEKLEIARQLASLGVDVMEAGFPASSPDELHAVRRIAEEVGTADGPIICGLARANRGDVEKCWQGVQFAAKPRIHTFIACSDLHLERKLEMTREQVVAQVRDMVELARSLCSDVEFSPEDASRADISFLVEVLSVAIEAGATTLNIPDTVGYATPEEYGALFRRLIAETNGGDRVVWSVHCHDDLGMATANSIAGLVAGARQAEVTINGIGERAGNTSLEEVVMALHTRHPVYGLTTAIDTVQLARTSKMVSNYTGIVVPPNKAIVGANAFAHEAGIHQDGMLKDHRTYEIMTPETVGLSHSKLVLGKHSGRHAFRIRLEELGHHLSASEVYPAFQRFKALAEKKKMVTDADLIALVASEVQPEAIYTLEDLQVTCGRSGLSTATARLRGPGGIEKIQPAIGTGPVDAAFRAIDAIVDAPNTLVEYSVHSVTEGIDALGEVTVRIKSERAVLGADRRAKGVVNTTPEGADAGRMFGGYGADTDVIIASAQAYLAAINRLLEAQGRGSRAREIGPATVRATGAMATSVTVKAVGEAS